MRKEALLLGLDVWTALLLYSLDRDDLNLMAGDFSDLKVPSSCVFALIADLGEAGAQEPAFHHRATAGRYVGKWH